MLGKPHEECGLFGIYNQDDLDVAEKTYLALYALQHRGQASAGIAVNQNGKISFHKDVGMVPEVFHESDLEELGQTDVMVVCAGAKAILDLKLTLEYLETHGVPVLGYQTKELPAFYTRKSGLSVDYQVDTPEELAKILKTQHDLGLKGGVLVTNPIPEEYSMDADAINAVIDRAIEEAKEKGIHGKETTPFLLAKVKEITGGDSLDANIQLVFNNAKLAAQTAVAYCKL